MAQFLIAGVSRGIGAALMAAAQELWHETIGTTPGGRYCTITLELSAPAAIAAKLAGLPPSDVLTIEDTGTFFRFNGEEFTY